MESYGWLSILPPVLAIGLAIKTKQVYLSLALFVFLGWTIMNDWNPLAGMIQSLDVYIESVTDADNARVLLFSVLIGAMITFTQASGGMHGFVTWVERSGLAKSRRSVGLLTGFVSMCVFLESNFSLLVSGSVARPLYDRCRISREKLAYVIDATCSPKCILIPLNAWGAYVISLLVAQEVPDPNGLLVSALTLNFYAILAIALAFVVILTGWNIGPMREAERRVAEEGKLLRDGAKPLMADDVAMAPQKEGVTPRAVNMILPIVTMVITVPIVLWITGDGSI
ncbi:MAG: Na+/H+ antiporter NhaC family protein, partial [Gemmatimonadales bacterium]